jgi:integrase
MLVKQFHYISKEESQTVLESIKYITKVIVLLMLDAGLRISEACSIKCKILILKSKYHNSISKKRGQNTCTIPISNRLYQAIGEYLKRMKFQ